jgi:Family of unknown function (DUF5678)
MNSMETLPAPVLPSPPEDKFRSEQRAFQELLPELLRTHRDQYVAIHEGRLVESGANQIEVAERAYARFGYIPILVTLVTNQPRPVVRMPSPRQLDKDLQDAIRVQPAS